MKTEEFALIEELFIWSIDLGLQIKFLILLLFWRQSYKRNVALKSQIGLKFLDGILFNVDYIE
jgi:hypothetical protein